MASGPVIISGASGLLGRSVYAFFCSKLGPENVVGLCYSRTGEHLQQVDLTKTEELNRLFLSVKPIAFIHCAAERRPDVCDKNEAALLALNVKTTEDIVQLCSEFNAYLIYVSTDYVFDGKKPPYSVSDEPNPLNSYGKSKLLGEQKVMGMQSLRCVLRVPILYGSLEYLSESAITGMTELLFNDKQVTVDHWAVRYPTHTVDVACCLYQLFQNKVNGITHFSAQESFTRYDIVCLLAKILKRPMNHISPDSNEPVGAVARPRDAQLDCSTLRLESVNVFIEPRKLSDEILPILLPFLIVDGAGNFIGVRK